MIELGIVDLSADGRRRLASLIERWSWKAPDSRLSVPRFSLHLLSPEELRFHGSLDVCVVGPELVSCDAAFVNNLRQQIPDKILICVLDSRTYSFGLVEQLGRLGVDDVLIDTATSEEFFRRVLLLQRRVRDKTRGRLVVVDSARGGVGKTFLAAALAEGWFNKGERVCVIDCDVVSQDLTRFLQVRPHINEPLRLLVDQQRVITSETVNECARPVWIDESRFMCVPPAAGGDEAFFSTAHSQRGFVAVIEALLLKYDRVLIDTSGLISAAKNPLFQICDELLFVVNRDASAAYANRQALSLIAGFLKPDAKLSALINDTGVGTASIALLKEQVVVIAGRKISHITVPRSPHAAAWVCSGYTPYRFLRRCLRPILSSSTERVPANSVGALTGSFRSVVMNVYNSIKRSALFESVRWGRASRVSASGEPWGERTELDAPPRLLSIGHAIPDDGALVSKPVLLG
jgi:MinD-like ATPase involved in chromosome partitioning or flagellar assembly